MMKLVCFFVRGLLGRETRLYFSPRISTFPSLIKNGGCRWAAHGPRGSGAAPAVLAEARQDRVGPFVLFRHSTGSHSSASPFWDCCLHPAPKAQGISSGKAQPARPRSCPVDNLRKRRGPGGPPAPPRPTREELPGTPATRGTTRLTPQPRDYKSHKALRAGPAAAWAHGA